jgi:hypothetical protein
MAIKWVLNQKWPSVVGFLKLLWPSVVGFKSNMAISCGF